MSSGVNGQNFLDEICVRALEAPEKPALFAPGSEPLSFRRLCEQARGAAGALARAGLNRGDVIAAALPNAADVLRACLGVAGVGAFAPLNPSLPQAELEWFLTSLGAAAVIAPSDSAAAAAARALGILVLELGTLTGQIVPPFTPPSVSDPAFFLHTSATTGRPKLVCLTHAKFSAMAHAAIKALGQTSAGRLLCMMPMFHLQGLKASLEQLMAGGSVLLASAAEAPKFPQWLLEYEPTWYTAGATLHRAFLAALRRSNTPAHGRLRIIRNMGTALPLALQTELEDTFGAPVINGYGLTETGTVASSPLPPGVRNPGSAGIAIGLQIAVLDGAGNISMADAEGEILVRGPSVIDGYWNDPEATRAAFHEGWFRTGDLGTLDREGYLYITGRIKEMINRGGEKILPGQIDEALMAHPQVAEAAAFAVPHPTLGEDIAAAVVLRPGSALKAHELRRFAAGRLAYFKLPRRILFVDEIPKSATGKPRRHALADLAGGPEAGRVPFARELERDLAEHWARFLGTRPSGAEDDFFELGGDSLSARIMLVEVQNKYGDLANEGEFLADPTIETLASLIESNRGPEGLARETALFALQPRGSLPPFFCIPGATEDPYYMRHLARRLGAGRPFYILRDARAADERDGCAIEDTASLFLKGLQSEQRHGPYFIGGHCYGGIVAFELARQLHESDAEIAAVVLFDTATPGYPKVVRNWKRYLLAAPKITPGELAEHVRFLAQLGKQRLGNTLPASGRSDPTTANTSAARRYEPKQLPARVFAFLAGEEHHSTRVLDDSRVGWRDFAGGGFEARVVPGGHMSMFDEPHVRELASQLEDVLKHRAPSCGAGS